MPPSLRFASLCLALFRVPTTSYRGGDGTLSLPEFRDALLDINVRVSEHTLLEVGRCFQASASKDGRGRHKRDRHDPGRRKSRGNKDIVLDHALIDISYVPLVEAVFHREDIEVPEPGPSQGGRDADYLADTRSDNSVGENTSDEDGKKCDDSDEDDDNAEHCFVNVVRIRAARVAAVEAKDALGRRPLFLAAATGAVSAAKYLIRHGAASSLAVDGTGLTAYSVAAGLPMRRVLASEARHSLDQAMCARSSRHCLGDVSTRTVGVGAVENTSRQEEAEDKGARAAAITDDDISSREVHRMEGWVSTLAEGELTSARLCDTLVDQKTSLHLAATAGLQEAVKDLLKRGIGKDNEGGRGGAVGHRMEKASSVRPAWTSSWQSPVNALEESGLCTAHCAYDHALRRDATKVPPLKTDGSGWSPLHACCAENSKQHYHCALALLGSGWDPNARTNTGKTPLHVASCATDPAGAQGGGVSHGTNIYTAPSPSTNTHVPKPR